jgi:hypothetical protein
MKRSLLDDPVWWLGFMRIAEAAQARGVSEEKVRRDIRCGRLEAEKLGLRAVGVRRFSALNLPDPRLPARDAHPRQARPPPD